MAREYLRLTPETVWGTYHSASTPLIVDIDQANAFDMRPVSIKWTVKTAGAFARRLKTGSAKTELKGNLKMLVRPSQAIALAAWIDAGGAAAPGSMTIDHAIVDESGTTHYRRYLGAMVAHAQFTASEQNPLLTLALQLVAKQPATITITDFPEPALADYATDAYYLFEQTSGAITVATSRAAADSFDVTVKNMLDGRFFNGQYLAYLKYCGRDVDFKLTFPYLTAVDRADYEAVTAVSGSVVFTAPGPHTLTFGMQAQNFFAGVKDSLDFNKLYLQECSLESYLDTTAGTDFALSAT